MFLTDYLAFALIFAFSQLPVRKSTNEKTSGEECKPKIFEIERKWISGENAKSLIN